MIDSKKSKKQLIEELEKLRKQVIELKNGSGEKPDSEITEYKRVEEVLKRQKEELQIIFDSVPAMIFFKDKNNRFIRINNALAKASQLPRDQIEGKTASEVYPDHAEEYWRDDMEVIESGLPKYNIVEPMVVGQETRWFQTDKIPYRDSSGNIVGIIGFSQDITERKQAEDDIRKFKTISDNASHGTAIFDIEGNIVYVNECFAQMHGYTSDELLGKHLAIFHNEEQMEMVNRINQDLLREGSFVSKEVMHWHRDGWEFPTLMNGAVVQGKDGSAQFIAAIAVDITETKRLQELVFRAERLEMAGTIAGQVAHDFNNLLAPIVVYPEFIHDELPHDHRAHVYLDAIEDAAKKITDINQDLLTMSRRGHYNQSVLNLNRIVLHAVKVMESQTNSVTCELDLCEDLMNIKGGEAQIHRMLTNLLVNARDAMQNIGQITIRTENYYAEDTSIAYGCVPKGEYVKLTISDTGCGIPDDIVQKVFDPFFTTKTTDKKRGSGLGMSVVDAVIKDHNGYIDLSTRVGEGTSFYIYFPITRESKDGQDPNEACGGSETILVVDDDVVQREVSAQLLKKLGYEVNTIENGEKAVEFLRENPQDLVILDMIMPGGIDGTETYRRALEVCPDQKAIIVSGFSESDRVFEAQKLGAGAFVRKPITKNNIAAAVRTELDR